MSIKICFETLLYVNGFGGKKWKFKVITQPLPTRARIPPGLAGNIEKFYPLPEPIRLQDSQNSARSRIEKKNEMTYVSFGVIAVFYLRC